MIKLFLGILMNRFKFLFLEEWLEEQEVKQTNALRRAAHQPKAKDSRVEDALAELDASILGVAQK